MPEPCRTGPTQPRCRRFPNSTATSTVDVVVVGGGITGLTTAYLLAAAGQVAWRSSNAIAARTIDTGHTTAHLTMVTDTRLSELSRRRSAARTRRRSGMPVSPPSPRSTRSSASTRSRATSSGSADICTRLIGRADRRLTETFQEEARLASEMGFDADVRRGRAVRRRAGRARSITRRGSIRGNIWPEWRRRFATAAGRSSSTREAEEFSRRAAWRQGERPLDYMPTTSSSPRTIRSSASPSMASATLFQTKLALYTSYVDRRPRAAGHGPRRAFLGHRGSVSLPQARTASRLRRRHLRR